MKDTVFNKGLQDKTDNTKLPGFLCNVIFYCKSILISLLLYIDIIFDVIYLIPEIYELICILDRKSVV